MITSTAGVFGPSEGGLVDEETPRRIPFFNAYESSKAEMHAAVKAKVAQGVDAVIVCPTRVYGPGPMVEGQCRDPDGRALRSRDDGARCREMGENPEITCILKTLLMATWPRWRRAGRGEAYILGGENATYREFFAQLASVSGKQHKLYPVPIQVLMAFAWSEQKRADWFGRKPLITPSWVRRYNHDWANSSAKATSELGYGACRLGVGLALTVEWLRAMEPVA